MSPLSLAFSVGTVWGAVVAVVVSAVTARTAPRCGAALLTVAGLAALGGLIGWGVSVWLS